MASGPSRPPSISCGLILCTLTYLLALMALVAVVGFSPNLFGFQPSTNIDQFGLEVWLGLIAGGAVGASGIALFTATLTGKWSKSFLLRLVLAGLATILITYIVNLPFHSYWSFLGVLLPLGNALFCWLVGVQIWQRPRVARLHTFAINSRLTSAVNPESGTISYQYDGNGNLPVKTDARGVSAHLSYDALNRAVRRWYNGSNSLTATTNNSPTLQAGMGASPEVNYFYDASGVDNSKGRLTSVTSVSSYSYSSYDAVGRVLGGSTTSRFSRFSEYWDVGNSFHGIC